MRCKLLYMSTAISVEISHFPAIVYSLRAFAFSRHRNIGRAPTLETSGFARVIRTDYKMSMTPHIVLSRMTSENYKNLTFCVVPSMVSLTAL